MKAITTHNGKTFGYSIGSDEQATKKLRAFLEKYNEREYQQTLLLENLEEIASIIADANYSGDTFKAKLLLFYDVFIRREHAALEDST